MTDTSHHILLGLGSNIGEKLVYIEKTIECLLDKAIITDITISNIYESKALLKEGAPDSWNKNFFNLCIYGVTNLSPRNLLDELKIVENNIGRQDRGIWSPREIDIDILLYDDLTLEEEGLCIPHKHFINRAFTLLPASDLMADYQYPKKGIFYKKTIKEIIELQHTDLQECWKITRKPQIKVSREIWR